VIEQQVTRSLYCHRRIAKGPWPLAVAAGLSGRLHPRSNRTGSESELARVTVRIFRTIQFLLAETPRGRHPSSYAHVAANSGVEPAS
jgi:hypothetical protein